jgi:hypothetical protein
VVDQNNQLQLRTRKASSVIQNTFSKQQQQQQHFNGTVAPVIFSHNQTSNTTNLWWLKPSTHWDRNKLMHRVGHYAQYLKDVSVQPYRDPTSGKLCTVTGSQLVESMRNNQNVLFFTNNQENEPFMKQLRSDYRVPSILRHINGFEIFSVLTTNQSHSFHRHGESWLGQVTGRRQWWFLPPGAPTPNRVNACLYGNTVTPPPESTTWISW